MKSIYILISLLALTWAAAGAESVIVYENSAQLRAQPKADAKVVGLVYGGDKLESLEARKGWIRVKSSLNQVGWLSRKVADLANNVSARPEEPRVKLLIAGNRHQRLARIPEARMAFVEVLLRYPNTYEAYIAVQNLLRYHRVATLPKPKSGHVSDAQNDQARKIGGIVLLAEARLLVEEERLELAGEVLAGLGDVAGAHIDGYSDLRSQLTAYVVQVAASFGDSQLAEAVAMFRRYCPDSKLPADIESRHPREAPEAPADAPASEPPTAD